MSLVPPSREIDGLTERMTNIKKMIKSRTLLLKSDHEKEDLTDLKYNSITGYNSLILLTEDGR